jgi:hypothetical protein
MASVILVVVVSVESPRPPAVSRGVQEKDSTDMCMSIIFKHALKKSTRFPR